MSDHANIQETKNKLQSLIADLRYQKLQHYEKLTRAIEEREHIASYAMPRDEVLSNLFEAIDQSAEKFEKVMLSVVSGVARRRHATGVNRSPDLVRELGNYSQLNIDSINYFMGDIIKDRLTQYVDDMPWPGGLRNGMTDDEYYRQLKAADAKIDQLKTEHDALEHQIMSILDTHTML